MAFEKFVLIIDDDLGFTYLLQKVLGESGISVSQVASVTNASEATRYVAGIHPYQTRRIPDLIFLDLRMDGMDGFGFLEWARLDPIGKEIPILVISGATAAGDRAKAAALGAMGFYEKPQEAAQLKEIIAVGLRKCFGKTFLS